MLHVMSSDSLSNADPSLTLEKVRGSSDLTSSAPKDEFAPSPDSDLSKPISELLRTETREIHEEIHHSEAASKLVSGELARSEYIRFLFMLWHIYDELERGLFEHRENPVIFQIYHPRVFSRATAVSFDICHHLDTVTWQTDPFYVEFFVNIPKPVNEYIERLKYLGRPEATPEEASLLASHAYVRYLGDLSGGQIIKRKIIKAYDMFDDGEGLAFYNFRTLDPRTGDRPAEMHEVRKIKDWFRRGIDEAVTTTETKAALITEANRAFRYNARLFSCIDASNTLEKEPLKKTSTLVTAGASLGTLIAVILAVSLTHFALVLGGFTGSSGGQKLESFFDYLRAFAGAGKA